MKNTYGMFVHYGPNTFTNDAWGTGEFKVEDFTPEGLEYNAKQWVKSAEKYGMDYIVIVAKHHDGFCLWDTKQTKYKITNSPAEFDLLKIISEQCEESGIKLGIYYSLWDKNYVNYHNDDIYYEFMKNQITELLENYGDVCEMWFDGAWDKDYPNSTWVFDETWEEGKTKDYLPGIRWKWQELYEHIHQLQPNCNVINNSGYDRPGVIKYMPVDKRTSERMNFVVNGSILNADPSHAQTYKGETYNIPLEYVTTLNPDWFYTGGSYYTQPEEITVYSWYKKAFDTNNSLLLNIGPDKNGQIIECENECLTNVKKMIEEL